MRQLVKTEWRLLLREPAALIWGIVFPLVLLGGLGALPSSREADPDLGGLRFVDVYLPVMMSFVLAMLAINSIAATVATYREKGILRRLATTPLPASRLLLAQVAVHVGLIGAALALMLGGAAVAFGVGLPEQPAGFALGLLLSTAALVGIGMLVGAVSPGGRSAGAVGALLFFPLMFFAGLWLPRELMPEWLLQVSDLTPLGAAVATLQTSLLGGWPDLEHLAVLSVVGTLCGTLASRLFRWE